MYDVYCCVIVQVCNNRRMKVRSSEFKYEARARVMKALANPARLKVIDELSQGERCLCELEPLFQMDKSTLSRHISALKAVGIVHERREGARIHLKLATPCILGIFDCVMNVLRLEAKRQNALVARS